MLFAMLRVLCLWYISHLSAHGNDFRLQSMIVASSVIPNATLNLNFALACLRFHGDLVLLCGRKVESVRVDLTLLTSPMGR